MIQSCTLNANFVTNFFRLMYCDVVEYLEDTYKDIVDYFKHLGKDDPIRETRGACFTDAKQDLLLHRSWVSVLAVPAARAKASFPRL